MCGLTTDSEIHSSAWELQRERERERGARVNYTQEQLKKEKKKSKVWWRIAFESAPSETKKHGSTVFSCQTIKDLQRVKAWQVSGAGHPLTRLLENVWTPLNHREKVCESLNHNPCTHTTCQCSQNSTEQHIHNPCTHKKKPSAQPRQRRAAHTRVQKHKKWRILMSFISNLGNVQQRQAITSTFLAVLDKNWR